MKRSRARSPEAIEFARFERATANEFARTVWQWIRNRQIYGQKFRREVPIPPYTADFCCVELKLIVEIDGARHFTEGGKERDRERDDFLDREGYRVVRIAGYEVVREDGEVLERIASVAITSCLLTPGNRPYSHPGRDDVKQRLGPGKISVS